MPDRGGYLFWGRRILRGFRPQDTSTRHRKRHAKNPELHMAEMLDILLPTHSAQGSHHTIVDIGNHLHPTTPNFQTVISPLHGRN